MAIISQNRRINPLDINRNVTIGVAFPLDEVNIFKGTETVREQVKSNLINLLLTEKGERVNEPNFGVGLKQILFEQNINKEEIEERINFQINFFIPGFVFGIGYLLYSIYGMKKQIGNIGHDAHFGGAVGGYIITLLLAPRLLEQDLTMMLFMGLPIAVLFIMQKLGKI